MTREDSEKDTACKNPAKATAKKPRARTLQKRLSPCAGRQQKRQRGREGCEGVRLREVSEKGTMWEHAVGAVVCGETVKKRLFARRQRKRHCALPRR